MNKYLIKKVPLVLSISVFILSCVLFIAVETFPGHREIYSLLIKQLTRVEPLPERYSISPSQSDNIVYILGGSQDDLERKIETASELYRHGLCKRILSLSRPGITEYDHILHRNLTNDEWFINKLVGRGVKKEDIELVILKQGFFGTLTEAKAVADTASQRGYKHLTLVTSPHHTMRTWLAFSKYVKERGIVLFVYASNYHATLHELIVEYFKLVFYRCVLIS